MAVLLVPRELEVTHSGGVKGMPDEQLERGIQALEVILAKRAAQPGDDAKLIEGAASRRRPAQAGRIPHPLRSLDIIGLFPLAPLPAPYSCPCSRCPLPWSQLPLSRCDYGRTRHAPGHTRPRAQGGGGAQSERIWLRPPHPNATVFIKRPNHMIYIHFPSLGMGIVFGAVVMWLDMPVIREGVT